MVDSHAGIESVEDRGRDSGLNQARFEQERAARDATLG
jgi:hypothetical protein